MPSTIPIALVNHYETNTLTTSYLLKIGPTPSASFFGMTSINRNEEYNDGDGVMTYYAASGIDLSALEASNDLAVVNGEANSLLSMIPGMGITQDMVDRGEIDTVPYIVYEHNYLSGATGEHRIVSSGTLGRCKIVQGLLVIPELRSWTQLLDQNGLISRTSISCRVRRFGSQEGEEREWCGYDIEANSNGNGEWYDFVVTDVGVEMIREFTITADSTNGLEGDEGYYAPGAVEWTEGDNAGFTREIESYGGLDSNDEAEVSLRFVLPKPVQIGDKGRIRRDCTRMWSGHNSCDTYFSTTKGSHFRGEPNIPIGNTMQNTSPGANAPATTGTGEAL